MAVIGAGIAGATAARTLMSAGHDVVVIDKSRGPGGRMATRRVTTPTHTITFDHGAPFTTAARAPFAAFLKAAMDDEQASHWAGAPTPDGVVGVPGMSALVRHQLDGIETAYGARVTALSRGPNGWSLSGEDAAIAGTFDALVLAIPSPQLVPLLAPVLPEAAHQIAAARYHPCWAVLMEFEAAAHDALAALRHDELEAMGIALIAYNGGKPQRHGATLVMHADPQWSQDNLEQDAPDIAADITSRAVPALHLPEPISAKAHRWRFSRVAHAVSLPRWFDEASMIGFAGDWSSGDTIEAAYESGLRVGEAVVEAGR
ncbi:MAG: FAD-dependent oxidoreductase [Pseudomonadota bacterium]